MHSTCIRCGSRLRNPDRMRLGISVACENTVGRVLDELGTSPTQNAKVGAALKMHSYEHVGPDLYRIQSASGPDRYLASSVFCQCPASRHGIPKCWHVALVRVLSA